MIRSLRDEDVDRLRKRFMEKGGQESPPTVEDVNALAKLVFENNRILSDLKRKSGSK